jgi:hypothetical protein
MLRLVDLIFGTLGREMADIDSAESSFEAPSGDIQLFPIETPDEDET